MTSLSLVGGYLRCLLMPDALVTGASVTNGRRQSATTSDVVRPMNRTGFPGGSKR